MIIELKQLRFFVALAEERNFGRAAERLHITQPPLTRTIQALESEVGTPLFIRTPKGAMLTPAGDLLLEKARQLLILSTEAAEQARQAAQGYTGKLNVGIFSSGVLNVIPQLLAAFHSARPEVKIGIYSMSKTQQLIALRDKSITIGFNRLVPTEADIAVDWVRREPFIVALYDGHPLSAKHTITLEDLDGEPMIMYPNAPVYGLMQVITSAFLREGVNLNVTQQVDDVLTCIALVANRFGVSITTESAEQLRLPGVVWRPLSCRYLKHIELNCLYRRDDTSPVLAAFLSLIRATRHAF
ncbi:LysR family transcriptional regulator [Mangrovibacter yixingensis]|uniref:LysR family transcriptional regulator n=1 Tax=Mangrovibacter yixingensis TaxID=1529639 RepID=UPI001CF9FE7D|nr:LysR family transcriptional regulator [Mangrovibacter yixingensis]